jgi:hypothetical protein
LEEIGIPELNMEQIAELCEKAEEAARDYVLSKVSTSRILTLNITVDAEGTKPVTTSVDVTVILSPLMENFDVEVMTKLATKRAFAIIEKYLRGLKCKSEK